MDRKRSTFVSRLAFFVMLVGGLLVRARSLFSAVTHRRADITTLRLRSAIMTTNEKSQ